MYCILIIDDYFIFCYVMIIILGKKFFDLEIFEVNLIFEVLMLLEKDVKFDLIMFDLNMLEICGLNGFLEI